tara:strand:+ start:597 stop:749 length:153 start_codon:yes stop_codon:yes gene_type:complete
MNNGFHKAGEVVDSSQVIVARNYIADSFTLYDVSLSIGGHKLSKPYRQPA